MTGFYLANTDLVKSGKVKKVVTTFDGQQYSFTSSNGKVTKINGKALKYDKKGNIIKYQEHKFHYNSNNLITKIQAGSDYEDFGMEFDSLGRLTFCEYLGTLQFPSGEFSYTSNSIAPTKATIVQCFSDSGDRFEMKNICTLGYENNYVTTITMDGNYEHIDNPILNPTTTHLVLPKDWDVYYLIVE